MMSQDICIYITHGGLSSLKSFAYQYRVKNPSEQQIMAKYDNGIFTVFPDKQQYTEAGFVKLVSNYRIVRLCCDSNLGEPGGKTVQPAVRSLVKVFKPKHLLLFSSTPECTADANQNYIPSLVGSPTIRAIAVDRKQMNGIIKGGIPLLEPTNDSVTIVSNEVYDWKSTTRGDARQHEDNETTYKEQVARKLTLNHPLTERPLLALSPQVDQTMIVDPSVLVPMTNQPKKPRSCLPLCLSWLFVSNKVSPENLKKEVTSITVRV